MCLHIFQMITKKTEAKLNINGTKQRTISRALCIMNYDTQLFQNISYFELLVNQFR